MGGVKSTMSQFIVYALHHVNSSRVYVGKSSSGLKRPRGHGHPWNLKKHARLPVVCWIGKLQRLGYRYEIVVLEECESRHALAMAEQFYISYFNSVGMRLLNQTNGGDGPSLLSEITRAKISARCRGRQHTSETRAKIAIAARNISDETRAKRSVSAKRAMTVEMRAHLSEVHKGKKLSEQQKKKM